MAISIQAVVDRWSCFQLPIPDHSHVPTTIQARAIEHPRSERLRGRVHLGFKTWARCLGPYEDVRVQLHRSANARTKPVSHKPAVNHERRQERTANARVSDLTWRKTRRLVVPASAEMAPTGATEKGVLKANGRIRTDNPWFTKPELYR